MSDIVLTKNENVTTLIRPAVHVAATLEDGVCDVSGCDLPPELVITFDGHTSPPQFRCLEHWGSAWYVFTDAGCTIEYSLQALKWIMCR